jgi:hypothetical protein
MEFTSADPSVIRSVKQRELLDTWLRARRKPLPLPTIGDYQPERIADELIDMMEFEVTGEADAARFLITHEGARLATTYGNEHIDPSQRTNRFLDDAVGPARYARVGPLYRACLARKRPIYSITTVQDGDGKEVSYERLLLPFGNADTVEQIVGSYKTISIEGRFKIDNLMGARPEAKRVSVVRAVIELDFFQGPAANGHCGEVIELS